MPDTEVTLHLTLGELRSVLSAVRIRAGIAVTDETRMRGAGDLQAAREHVELRERYEEIAAKILAADPGGSVKDDPPYSETSWPTPAEEARTAACPMCGARAGEACRTLAAPGTSSRSGISIPDETGRPRG